jgi:hypothetical protein
MINRMKTKTFLVKAKSPSIRTTIPIAVAEYLGLQGGEEISWAMDMMDGNRFVVVKKA